MTDYGHALQFGVFITPAAGSAERGRRARDAGRPGGLDLVTFQDHPYQARFLDTWTLLSFVAARTSRVRVAPNVLNLPLRQPAVVARAVASLDLLSGGRVELGLGAGAFWDGIEAMGGRRRTPGAERRRARGGDRRDPRAVGRRAARRGTLRRRLLPARGRGARARRRCTTIDIWIGAYKPRMLALTGRKADGWLPSLPYLQAGRPGGRQRGDRRGRARGAAATRARSAGSLNVAARRRAGRRRELDAGSRSRTASARSSSMADDPRDDRDASRPRSRRPCASWWPPSGDGGAVRPPPDAPRRARRSAREPGTSARRHADPGRRHAAQRHGAVGRVDPPAPRAVRRRA